MIETLRRICALQSDYSPDNTPAMKERGQLVRQVLRAELEALAPELRLAMGAFGSEFETQASDGIGRKTEAPWLRFFARTMSPDPRHGFYAVIHFAANGTAVFVTVGCGATTWANGELRALTDEDLQQKRQWAQRVITDRFGSIDPFGDQIDLGAHAKLPRAFEKATAVAKKLPVGALDEGHVTSLLVSAARHLGALYEAQRVGLGVSAFEYVQTEVDEIARPTRATGTGQGFRLSQEERVAIELRAMKVSRLWLEAAGYACTDTSKRSPFDFLAVKASEELKVEVKGTTVSDCSSIFMTRNEVELHRSEKGTTALLIVAGITIQKVDGVVIAEGGTLTEMMRWDIDLWDVVPMAYQIRKRL